MQDTPKNTPIIQENAISFYPVSSMLAHDNYVASRRRPSGERPPGRNWLDEKSNSLFQRDHRGDMPFSVSSVT
jgi:hypothetical protein